MSDKFIFFCIGIEEPYIYIIFLFPCSWDIIDFFKNDFETISDTLALADLFYKSSFIAIKEIPFKFRFALLVARRVYKKIGDKILRTKNIENYNKAGKIYVNNITKIYQTILSIFDLVTLFVTKQKSGYMNNEHFLISEEIDLNERI